MTREEAIQALKDLADMNVRYGCDDKWIKALNMAIEALSKVDTTENPKCLMSHEEAWAEIESDLISRADAIEAVLTYFIPRSHTGERGEHEEDFVRTIFNALPSAEAEWIPCSERLPSEKDGQILVTKRGEVRIATYSEFSGKWYLGDMCAVGGENPIAWMPLPKPYKGGDDE